jgi:S1-C subfamily serine protease
LAHSDISGLTAGKFATPHPPHHHAGHISDVLDDKIVYDDATTSDGSGGPLFNRGGKVIAINFAVLRDFGGSNLAVPVKYAKDLLR